MSDHHRFETLYEEFETAWAGHEVRDPFAGWEPCSGGCPECAQFLLGILDETLNQGIQCGRDVTTLRFLADDRVRRLLADDAFEKLTKLETEYRAKQVRRQLDPGRGSGAAAVPGPVQIPGLDWRDRIGDGSSSEVWRAENPEMQRSEAVKVAKDRDPATAKRLKTEAGTLGALDHPNVRKVYHFDTALDGRSYLRMQFIDGPTLRERMRSAPGWAMTDVARWVAGLARGLQAAHDRGVWHRDLKPENVLVAGIGPQTRFVLTDFDLADQSRGAPEARPRLIGTPAYWSPEHAHGAGIDRSSDIYALGLVLYELACGRHPFGPDGVDLIRDAADDPNERGRVFDGVAARVRPPRAVDGRIARDLDAIIRTALRTDPEARYRTARAMAEDLEAFAGGFAPLHALGNGSLARCGRWVRRNPVRSALTAAGAVAAVVLLSAAVWVADRSRQDAWNEADERAIEALLADGPTAEGRAKIGRLLLDIAGRDPARAERVGANVQQRERAAVIASLLSQEDLRRMVLDKKTPYVQHGSIKVFQKPDPKRADDLKLTADGLRGWADNRVVLGVEYELIRTSLALGRPADARAVAEGILDRAGVPDPWWLVVCRDYVWALVEAKAPLSDLQAAEARIDRWLADGSDRELVRACRAVLRHARGDRAGAVADLDACLTPAVERAVDFAAPDSNPGNDGGGPPDNVPALLFLDACLMRGFLLDPGPARAVWARGFRASRGGKEVAATYEAAILGSLCGELEPGDAMKMIQVTVERAAPQGESQVVQLMGALLTGGNADQKKESQEKEAQKKQAQNYLKFVTAVLRDAWVSPAGKAEARDIAFRRMPFAVFTRAQARRWLVAGMAYGVAGWADDGKPPRLTDAQTELLEQLGRDLERAYVAGEISERDIAAVLVKEAGVMPVGIGLLLWDLKVPKLAPQIRGPVDYVLSRHFETNRHDPARAEQYRKSATEAVKAATPLERVLAR